MKFACGLLAALCWVSPAYAFYTAQHDAFSATGVVYAGWGKVGSGQTSAVTGRLMVEQDMGNWHGQLHLVGQDSITNDVPNHQPIDRLNLSYSNDTFAIKVGRQAVSLATTFFFSPNDFFAPFSALSFNRDYKQGVDALQMAYQLGDLSQLSAVVVQHEQANTPASWVITYDTALENMTYTMFAAEIHDAAQQPQRMLGGSLQADLVANLGMRAEGHVQRIQQQDVAEWVLALDYRWQHELSMNIEWFHHGQAMPSQHLPYSGKAYLGIGFNYPFTPLLQANVNSIINIDDHGQLQTAQAIYSLSDNTALQGFLLIPTGSNSSEFSLYPQALGLEYQAYF